MSIDQVLSQIDAEIDRLQEVRKLLAGNATGKPKTKSTTAKTGQKRRTMSPEGRARIAAAQKKRWAAQKKAAK